MGLITSFLAGRGSPTAQMVSLATGTLYNSFLQKDTSNFEDFHTAMLDIFNTFNSALPGKHYDVPSREEVQVCFEEWEKANAAQRKQVFLEFVKGVSLNKMDNSTLITGMVTPPVAMIAKKAGQRIPPLTMIKVIPDVLFIPSATVLALISVKVSRKLVTNKRMKKDEEQ